MNTVTMIGRLTRDPEAVTTDGGTEICNLRIAVDRRKRDDGAVFVDVKAFQGLAHSCSEYLEKGRQVAVTGRLELDEWTTEDDQKRSRLYVIANSVEFLAGRRSEQADPDEAEAAATA